MQNTRSLLFYCELQKACRRLVDIDIDIVVKLQYGGGTNRRNIA